MFSVCSTIQINYENRSEETAQAAVPSNATLEELMFEIETEEQNAAENTDVHTWIGKIMNEVKTAKGRNTPNIDSLQYWMQRLDTVK